MDKSNIAFCRFFRGLAIFSDDLRVFTNYYKVFKVVGTKYDGILAGATSFVRKGEMHWTRKAGYIDELPI